MMNKVKIFKLVISVLVCQAAGLIGSVFTAPNIATWYAGVAKPAFNPPNWLFAPVWTTLFLLMGISLYLVFENGLEKKDTRFAVSVFGVQLILNIIWSAVFFGLQNPFLGLVEIIVLWLAILANIVLFCRISKIAGYLLIPYILWVSFAAFLNYNIWILNL